VSLAFDGSQGNNSSYSGSISSDGRYVAFYSPADNLVPGDTNAYDDVFVRDRQAGTIERVSVASDGSQGNGDSSSPSMSDDGRYVAFRSYASNLVLGDANGRTDIFVYDRQTDTIERVSLASDGTEGNGWSSRPSISGDGRYVAFHSDASNLVTPDTNGCDDVFVYDRDSDTIERVSVASDGSDGSDDSVFPSISADGRYVAFSSIAYNLVPQGDTNGKSDVFVFEFQTKTLQCVSLSSHGLQGDDASRYPSVSAGGRYVAFSSLASNLVPVLEANGDSLYASISADGRYVTFYSSAYNLVPGDTNQKNDIFVYDRQSDSVERVSIASDGSEANDDSFYPSISADGRYVTFHSLASNLIPNDNNGFADVFVYDRQTDTIERVSVASDGSEGDADSSYPSMSTDGRYVAFKSYASNLVPADTNGTYDVFVYDRQTGAIERGPPDRRDRTRKRRLRRLAGERPEHLTQDQRRRSLRDLLLAGQESRARGYKQHLGRLRFRPADRHRRAGERRLRRLGRRQQELFGCDQRRRPPRDLLLAGF